MKATQTAHMTYLGFRSASQGKTAVATVFPAAIDGQDPAAADIVVEAF